MYFLSIMLSADWATCCCPAAAADGAAYHAVQPPGLVKLETDDTRQEDMSEVHTKWVPCSRETGGMIA